jgi:hypothetical protein
LATTVAGLKPYANPKGKGKGKGKGNAKQTSNDEIKQRRKQATARKATARTSNGEMRDRSLRSG